MLITKGQTEKHEWTITNENGAVDLTGSTVRLTIEDLQGVEVYTQEKTTFDAPTSGIVTFVIPKETTVAFDIGSIKAQLDVLNTSDERDYNEIQKGNIIDSLAQ